MKRRCILKTLPLGMGLATAGETTPKRIETIYSNDTTHILSCKMPWRERTDEFRDSDLEHSIKEAAQLDAHFLQPGLGWIPWWKSNIYSAEDHYTKFLGNHGSSKPDKVGRYLLAGGDLLSTLVKVCQAINVLPFLSFRLNDGHHVRELTEALQKNRPSPGMSRFYWENYKNFRIGADPKNWDEGVFDWAISEVRDHKFSLIAEACSNYDLAGLELDFLRHLVRFGPGTPDDVRRQITTEFVLRIRGILDRASLARGIPRHRLCIRVPADAKVRLEHGIDLAELTAAGVDMINLSHSYFTWQDGCVAQARNEVDDKAALYLEMTHCTMTGKATSGSGTQPFLRTTDEQFYTTAQLAYEQSATGVSLFNFPYYRYHVTDQIGPFHEPPFHVLPKLKDRAFLSCQLPSYFLSQGRKDLVLGEQRLPALLQRKQPQSFTVPILTSTGENRPGILRLRSDEDISDRTIEVRIGGAALNEVSFVEKPIPHPYDACWLGTAEEWTCFSVPEGLVTPGKCEVSITVKEGIRVRVIFLDLMFPRN